MVKKQQLLGWGESVIEQVSVDLQAAFPGSTGYSPRKLRSAKQLYLTYCDPAIWLQPVAKLNPDTVIPILQQLVAEVPWGHDDIHMTRIRLEAPQNSPRHIASGCESPGRQSGGDWVGSQALLRSRCWKRKKPRQPAFIRL
jgi:hypothetical protein